jgi:hypothetical protein
LVDESQVLSWSGRTRLRPQHRDETRVRGPAVDVEGVVLQRHGWLGRCFLLRPWSRQRFRMPPALLGNFAVRPARLRSLAAAGTFPAGAPVACSGPVKDRGINLANEVNHVSCELPLLARVI